MWKTFKDKVAIVGATGVVGRELVSILVERGLPASRLVGLAGTRSAGPRMVPFGNSELTVQAFSDSALNDVAIAFFATPADVSRELCPIALRHGAVVIDNSSAFRLDPSVPLVVPEVNAELLHQEPPPALIANPNCSAVLLLVALQPLRRWGIRRIDVATYQAVSGAGFQAVRELERQTEQLASHRTPTAEYFREVCAQNLFSHESAIDEATGLNVEEQKIIDETRKIWSDPHAAISPTCVRVGVMRAHSQAITIELAEPASLDEVRAALERGSGIRVLDDRESNDFPTPLKATGTDEVWVGRLRPDPSDFPPKSNRRESIHRRFCMFISGDQLRKGAALNAVQIAEHHPSFSKAVQLN